MPASAAFAVVPCRFLAGRALVGRVRSRRRTARAAEASPSSQQNAIKTSLRIRTAFRL